MEERSQTSREVTARKFLQKRKRIFDIEVEIEELRKKQKDLIAKNPWLGNLQGLLKDKKPKEEEKKDLPRKKKMDAKEL